MRGHPIRWWVLVVLLGVASLGSGFLAAVTQVAARSEADGVEALRLGPFAVGQVPAWP